jgi:hypothetical protein
LTAYRELLAAEPWTKCSCPICTEHGIEVAIFRGNNRNRRRGFHNTRQFYDQFEEELPKILVVTTPDASLPGDGSIEEYLVANRAAFWSAVHDLPVAEVGLVTADGVFEWWADRPRVSLDPDVMIEALAEGATRYQDVFLDTRHWSPAERLESELAETDCTLHTYEDPETLRAGVLDRLGYGESFLPKQLVQSGLSEY